MRASSRHRVKSTNKISRGASMSKKKRCVCGTFGRIWIEPRKASRDTTHGGRTVDVRLVISCELSVASATWSDMNPVALRGRVHEAV